MEKNFTVDKDGRVFLLVSKDVAKDIFKNCKEKKVYLFYGNRDSDEVQEKREIKSHKGDVGVYVGTLRELLAERKALFPSLESVAQYYTLNGRLPWGMKSLISARGWISDKVEGYRYVIRDESWQKEFRVSNDGKVEVCGY